MYEHFYNLSAEPFRLSPDHRFCYNHANYAKAKAYMAYAFMRAEGFVLITGEPGTGKTTLVGDLIETLADENVVVGNLVSTQLAADDLLRMVAFSFGVDAETSEKSVVLQHLTACFLNLYRTGGRALLIVDEAQDLTAQALEELRLLTNLQENGQPLLQIFLLGQPNLLEVVHTVGLEQVHQRIVAASQMEALGENETRAYVEHRLHVVGWENDPAISAGVYPIIYLFSQGVPRRINLICSRLFLHSSVEQRHQITVEDARIVVTELQEEQLSTRNILHHEYFHAGDVFELVLPSETHIEDENTVGEADENSVSETAAASGAARVADSPPSSVDVKETAEAGGQRAPKGEVVTLDGQQLAPEILEALIAAPPEREEPSTLIERVETEREEGSIHAEPCEVTDHVKALDDYSHPELEGGPSLPVNDPDVQERSSSFTKWVGIGFALILVITGGLLALQMGVFCESGLSNCASLDTLISRVREWIR